LSPRAVSGTLRGMRNAPSASVASLALLLFLGALSAGCGPRWTVIRQAVPDPFVNQRQFFIEPVHSEHLEVGEKSEAVYLADKTPEQAESWKSDKREMIGHYSDALMAEGKGLLYPTQPNRNAFIVRPIVLFVEPGFYAYVAAHPTEVEMRVEILAPSGQPLDAITIRSVIGASMTNAASGTRMQQAAEDLGQRTAEYLKTRVFP
jgi:hypothetical protein